MSFPWQTGWKLVRCLLVSDLVLMGVCFSMGGVWLFWQLEIDGSALGVLIVVVVPVGLFLE